MRKEDIVNRIKNRIDCEFRKHKDLDWSLIAAIKIYDSFVSRINGVDFCNCGNPSREGNVQFINDEELAYFCCDCNKRVRPKD